MKLSDHSLFTFSIKSLVCCINNIFLSLSIYLVRCTAETNVSIGKFCSCSNLIMPKIYSQDHCMALVFKSDESKKGAGFVARYKSADNNATELDSSSNCRCVLCDLTSMFDINFSNALTL